MVRRLAVVFGLVLAVTAPTRADAAQITLFCSVGIKPVVEALLPQFEKASGHHVTATYDLAANLKRQIEAGAAFDVAIITGAMIDDLIKQGRVAADSRTNVAQVGLAIMIRKGAARADISTVDAFRRALLDASSIAYAREGASGVAFAALVQRLGIAEQLKAKSQLTESGDAVGAAVTSGKAQFGVLPVSEILPVAGAEVLAPFPAGAQSYIVMVAGINAAAPQRAAASALIKFLTAPAVDAVVKQRGMERVTAK
jgi:molybdate transport system substrate-binding protein